MSNNQRNSVITGVSSIGVIALVAGMFMLPTSKASEEDGVIRGQSIELTSPDGQSVIFMSAANDTATITIKRGRNAGFISLQSSYSGDAMTIGGAGGESIVVERAIKDPAGATITPTASIKVLNEVGLPIKTVPLD